MATDIVIPQVGESVSEGVIAAWLVGDGEHVDRDDPVLEIETDKITVEVPAPASGAVKHSAKEGDTVEVGATVGSIDESAGGSGKKAEKAEEPEPDEKQESQEPRTEEKQQTSSAQKSEKVAEEAREKMPSPAVAGAHGEQTTGGGASSPAMTGDGDVSATPLARKLASDHQIDLSRITPTGPSGRVREQDVLAAIQSGSTSNGAASSEQLGAAAPASPTPPAGERGVTVKKMSPLRKRIAQRLVEAQQTAAMLTTFNECDMTNVMALRSKHKESFQKTHGVKLGFMSFFIKAAVSALKTYPAVNSSIVEQDGAPATQEHHYCDVAVAVGTDKGLVVPVLRNCESLSFADIERGLGELAEKARTGKLSLDEMQGGTFTISNGGVYGSMMSTPILNPPQSGILGMHNIIKRPIEHPEKPGEIALRPMMYLALSYDHRIVDGAGAVGFLKHIKECIEDPERLMLGV
jgi:2-oxoglutarate dehydrogenase E2 component (dihydrolipoamide succinyltransferase)